MKKSLSRRDFLKYCGIGTAGIAAAAALAGCSDNSADSNEPDDNTSQSGITAEINQGESATTQKELDTTRETTANTDKLYPCLSYPITSDPKDMDVRNWWSKGTVSAALFECMGEDNKDTYFPDWIMLDSYTESDNFYVTYEYEKNASGENTKWISSVTEVPEGTEGAVEAFTWDVKLFDYIYDQDGRNITAEDVVYSYKEELNSGYALKYNAFIWCEAVDTYTVRFYWNRSEFDALGSLEFPMCKTTIYSKEGAEAGDFITKPVTTSAYKLVSYVSGSEVVLEATGNYWQTDDSRIPVGRRANVKTLKFPIITEPAQIVIALETGVANYSGSVPTDDLPTFDEGGDYGDKFQIFRAPSASCFGIIINCYEGHPGADPLFREGVCWAIDTSLVAQGAGASYFAVKGPGTWGAADYDTALDDEVNCQTGFDPEKAKELIDQSSYSGEKLTYLYGISETHQGNAAQVIQVLLQNVGVTMELNGADSNIVNADTPNPDTWDFYPIQCQGGTMVGGMNRMFGRTDFDTTPYIGYKDCVGFQNDDHLFELFQYANNSQNYGKEATAALLSYVVDNAYMKFCYGGYSNLVYTVDMAEMAFKYGNEPCPWASTFYVDDQITDIS